MALNFDFIRQIDSNASPANTISYYDTWSQAIYTDGGYIKTQIGVLDQGDWLNIVREPEIAISNSGFSLLDIEHGFNGTVYGIAQYNDDVVLLIYDYLLDVTEWLLDGSMEKTPNENPIIGNDEVGKIYIGDVDIKDYESGAYSLFYPGNKITFTFKYGDEFFDTGTYFIENVEYVDRTTSYEFSGRNTIGFFLVDQSFDENISFTGTRSSVLYEILAQAGIAQTDIIVQVDGTALTADFADDQKYIDGIKSTCESIGWVLNETPGGQVVVGTQEFVDSYINPDESWTFVRDVDLINRSTMRSIEDSYRRVCVRRKGTSPLSIYATVPTFEYWGIVPYKTYYYDVPDDMLQAEMEAIRDELLEYMEYHGQTETLASPFRPYLRIGNHVDLSGGEMSAMSGNISKIFHRFGRNGFYTQFDVESGNFTNYILAKENDQIIADQVIDQNGGTKKIWTGSQAEYDALPFIDPNTIYIIGD